VLDNREITIYKVMKDEVARTVDLKYVSLVPVDAAYHLSANAEYLCVRNYRQYIFVDANSGDELWMYDNNIINPLFSNHIIWIDFINNHQMIGVHRKIKSKTIFLLSAKYDSANTTVLMPNQEYKRFVFDHEGKGCVAERDKELYHIDFNSNDATMLMSGFDRILKKNINKDYIAVLFIENDKYYFALFRDDERLYKVV
jgi:hypothetical protein